MGSAFVCPRTISWSRSAIVLQPSPVPPSCVTREDPALMAVMMFAISCSTSWRRTFALARSGVRAPLRSASSRATSCLEDGVAFLGEQVPLDGLQQHRLHELA